jgi:Leucine-rich repeat (LRR) protein
MNAISELPPEFFTAKALQEVNLNTNHIADLPDTIGNLLNLVSLDVSINSLKQISPQLGTLPSLRVLLLQTNALVEVPFTLGWLYKTLKKLNLSSNKIKNVPGEFSFFPNTIELSLANTEIKVPALN